MVALTATRSPEADVSLAQSSPIKTSPQQSQPTGIFGGLARSLTIRPRSNSKRQNSLRRATGGRAGLPAESTTDTQRHSNEGKSSGEGTRTTSPFAEPARSATPVASVPTTSFSGSPPQQASRVGSIRRPRRTTLQSTDLPDAVAATTSVLGTSPSDQHQMSRPRRHVSTTSRAVSGRAAERLEWGEPPRNANAALRDEAIGVNSPPSDGWAGPRQQSRHQRASSEAGQRSRGRDTFSPSPPMPSQDLSQGTGSTSLVSRLSLRRKTSRKSPPRSGSGGASPPRSAPRDLLEAEEPLSQAPSPSVPSAPRFGRRSFDSLTSQELRDEPPAYSAPYGTMLLDHGGGLPASGRSERVHAPIVLGSGDQGPALPGSTDLLRRSRTQHRSVTFAGTPPAAAPRRGHNLNAGARQSWASSHDSRVDGDPFGDESLDGDDQQAMDSLDRTASGRLRPVISSTTRAKPVHEGSTLPVAPAYPSGYWAPPSNGARLASGSSLRAGSAAPSPTPGGARRTSRTNAAGEGMMDAREYMRARDELMKSSGPFYAVRRGWKKGVYTRKDEADRQTRGFPGPQMSEFATADEALEWLASANAPVPSSTGLIIAGTSSPSTTSLVSLAPGADEAQAGSTITRSRSPESPFGLLAEQASAASNAGPSPASPVAAVATHGAGSTISVTPDASPVPPPPPPKTRIVDWEQFDDSASLMESIASPRASLRPSPAHAEQTPSSPLVSVAAPVVDAAPPAVAASFEATPAPAPSLSLSSCAALLNVANVEDSVSFYTDLLGAAILDRQGALQARLRLGEGAVGADLWLRAAQPGAASRGPSTSLFTLDNVTEEAIADLRALLAQRLASSAVKSKANASIGNLEKTPWGSSEFSINDLDGHTLVMTTQLG